MSNVWNYRYIILLVPDINFGRKTSHLMTKEYFLVINSLHRVKSLANKIPQKGVLNSHTFVVQVRKTFPCRNYFTQNVVKDTEQFGLAFSKNKLWPAVICHKLNQLWIFKWKNKHRPMSMIWQVSGASQSSLGYFKSQTFLVCGWETWLKTKLMQHG